MDNQVSPAGAAFLIFVSIIYLILFFVVQFKVFNRRGKKAEHFCERAERDGRMVIACRNDYRIIHGDDNRWEYIGKYSYTAPNGKQYKMRLRDRWFTYTPPETITLYLEEGNYRRYYTKESLKMGKHGDFFFLLYYAAGLILYLALLYFVIGPVVFP